MHCAVSLQAVERVGRACVLRSAVVQFTLQMYVPSFRQISSRALQAVVCEC